MYESYSEAGDRGAILAAETSESVRRTLEHRGRDRAVAGGSGGTGLLDVLGEDEPTTGRRPAAGASPGSASRAATRLGAALAASDEGPESMSKQPGVMFTEPNEFVGELARDHARGLVERGIVRVTKVGRPAMNATITRVAVEAAAIVDSRCVRLRHPCGELWGRTPTSGCSGARASWSASLKRLLDGGPEVRAGVFDED